MNPERIARAGLVEDGAQSRDAMHRRLQTIAAEQGIAPEAYRKLLYKRPATGDVVGFCVAHDISLDWLLYGDLRGLRRMMRWRKTAGLPL
jgi:hypothetical protein